MSSGITVLLKIDCTFSRELNGSVHNAIRFYLEPYLFFQPSQQPFENHLTKPPYSIGLIADGSGRGTEEDPLVIGGFLEVFACSFGDEDETVMFDVNARSMRTCLRALMAGSNLTFTISDYESDPPIKARFRLPNTTEFSKLYERLRRAI